MAPIFNAITTTAASALDAAAIALQLLGLSPGLATQTVQQFRAYDERRLKELTPHRHDEEKLIALARRERENLNQLLTNEVSAPTGRAD